MKNEYFEKVLGGVEVSVWFSFKMSVQTFWKTAAPRNIKKKIQHMISTFQLFWSKINVKMYIFALKS